MNEKQHKGKNQNTPTEKHALLELIQKKFPDFMEEKSDQNCLFIHQLALLGNYEILNLIRKNQPDLLNRKDENGRGLAHYAGMSGQPDMLDWARDTLDEQLTAEDEFGYTFFHYALLSGKTEALARVEKYQGKPLSELQDKLGYTFLHYALLSGKLEVLEQIEKDFPGIVLMEDQYGYSLLHYAMLGGRGEIFEWAVNNCPELLDQKDPMGYTILDYMKKTGSEQILAKALLLKQTPRLQAIQTVFQAIKTSTDEKTLEKLQNLLAILKEFDPEMNEQIKAWEVENTGILYDIKESKPVSFFASVPINCPREAASVLREVKRALSIQAGSHPQYPAVAGYKFPEMHQDMRYFISEEGEESEEDSMGYSL